MAVPTFHLPLAIGNLPEEGATSLEELKQEIEELARRIETIMVRL
jgi:hypothetical protein